MDLVFYNYNDKINLPNIPFLDELKFLNPNDSDDFDQSQMIYDSSCLNVIRKIFQTLELKEESNRKLLKIMVNFLAKLKEQIDIEFHENLYLVLNSYIEKEELLILQKKFIECAFLSKIDSDANERVYLPYLFTLVKQIVSVLVDLRQRRPEISLTCILLFNVSKEDTENEAVYFGVGFVNNKTEVLLLLEEFRLTNYAKNKIPKKLIPTLSKTSVGKILWHYITILRSFIFGDDGNIKEKDLQKILNENKENLKTLKDGPEKKQIEAMRELLDKVLPNKKKIYIMDFSKVDFEQNEMLLLFLINCLFYTFDMIWRKVDFEGSYICEVIENKLIFVFYYNQILDEHEYNDFKSITALCEKLTSAIHLIKEEKEVPKEKDLSFDEEKPRSKPQKKEETDTFYQYFKRNRGKPEKKVESMISYSMTSAAKWSMDYFQETSKDKIQNLQFQFLPLHDRKNIDNFLPRKIQTFDEAEKPLEEFKRMLVEKGMNNATLADKTFFNNIRIEIQQNISLINYCLLPKIYYYFMVAAKQALGIQDVKLVEFQDFRIEMILRKLIEFFIYEEDGLLQVTERYKTSPTILHEFWYIYVFKLLSPYNSNNNILKAKWSELLTKYLEDSFTWFLKTATLEDESSQILLQFLKTCLLQDENDEFLELLLLQIKPILNFDYSSLNPAENQNNIKLKVYLMLIDNNIFDSLPIFTSDALLDIQERLLKFLDADKTLSPYVNAYACGVYFYVLLLPIFQGKNTNYLSYTNKNTIFLSSESLAQIKDIFIFQRQTLAKFVPEFETKIKSLKEKNSKNTKFKNKKQIFSVVVSTFLSGVNINFLLNIMRYLVEDDKIKSEILDFFRKIISYEPSFINIFEQQLNDRNLFFITYLNATSKDSKNELAEFNQSQQKAIPVAELIKQRELIPLLDLLSNATNQNSPPKKAGKIDKSFEKTATFLKGKAEVINALLSIEDPLYNRLKDLIPIFNQLSQSIQEDHSRSKNNLLEVADEYVRVLIRQQDDLSKYYKVSKLLSDYSGYIQERINLLNMNIDFVENFSDIADSLRKVTKRQQLS